MVYREDACMKNASKQADAGAQGRIDLPAAVLPTLAFARIYGIRPIGSTSQLESLLTMCLFHGRIGYFRKGRVSAELSQSPYYE